MTRKLSVILGQLLLRQTWKRCNYSFSNGEKYFAKTDKLILDDGETAVRVMEEPYAARY